MCPPAQHVPLRPSPCVASHSAGTPGAPARPAGGRAGCPRPCTNQPCHPRQNVQEVFPCACMALRRQRPPGHAPEHAARLPSPPPTLTLPQVASKAPWRTCSPSTKACSCGRVNSRACVPSLPNHVSRMPEGLRAGGGGGNPKPVNNGFGNAQGRFGCVPRSTNFNLLKSHRS